VFDTVEEAKAKTGADASVIYVPPAGAADAICEAIDAEIPLIVCITEGIPVADMIKVQARAVRLPLAARRPELPGRHDGRRMQDRHHAGQHLLQRLGRDRVALGTLTYEAGVPDDPRRVLGQTTAVGIGGDPVKGTEFIEVLDMFLSDPRTESIVMIGEIGGSAEEDAAEFMRAKPRRGRKKPMVGFIAGPHRAARPPHGPSRRHHLRRQGRRRGQDRRHGGRRHPRLPLAGAPWENPGRGAQGLSPSRSALGMLISGGEPTIKRHD
jgi:succinyl-CoA synthetase alpha subunit